MYTLRIIAILGCLCLSFTNRLAAQIKDAAADELIKQLADKDVERRRDAAYELVRRNEPAEAVIIALGTATDDDDTQIRVQALTGLARAGKKSEPVIPQLLKCLDNRDDQVRYRAAAALGAIGLAAIEPLELAWSSASNDGKIAAAQALAIIGPAADSSIDLLTAGLDGEENLPRYAAEALVAISPQDETTLLKIADRADAAARKVGIGALAALGAPSDMAIKKLQDAAADAEPKIRETAIVAVAKSRLSGAEKAALIETALVDEVASVRAAAIVAMRKAALPAGEFADRLELRLQSTEGAAANAIIKALGTLGREASGALPGLLAVLGREGVDEQQLSQTLANLGSAVVPELLSAIEKQPEHEPTLARALGLIGEPAVESLLLGLASDVELVRMAATRAIGGVRPLNQKLLEKLVDAVADPSAKVREIALVSLIAAASEADFAQAAILKAIEDLEPKVRAVAFTSLSKFKFSEDQLRTAFERGLRDEASAVRAVTLQTLCQMPKLLKSRQEQLVVLVGDPDASVRTMAVQALRKLDKKQVGEAVVRACVEALGDEDRTVQMAATELVKSLEISDRAVLDALSNNLIDDVALLRVTLEAIAGFGDKAASLIPSVSRLVAHDSAELRVAALTALAAIEKDPQQLTGLLTEALSDQEWEVRRVAGVALGKLGPDSKSAVPKLFQLLANDEDRDFASSALKEINTAPIEAIPMLMEKLESDERRTAFYAVSLLGKIGPPAAEALPKLEAMLENPRGTAGRGEFRKKFLVEAIAAIKGEVKSDK